MQSRPLIPHEHGAWGQLVMPLAAALAIGRPGLAAGLVAAGLVLAFVAHEPLLVLLGHRGARVRAEDGPRARRWLAGLGAGAALCGGVGLALAPAAARWAALVPLALAGAVAVLVRARREKTVLGEAAVAAALASAAGVAALAAGAAPRAALAATLAWILAFAAATLGVHVILARARSRGARDPGPAHAAGVAALGALAVGLHLAGLPAALPLAAAPAMLVAAAACLARISPRRLRPLGWALVGASAVALLVLVIGLR
jgi:hypothetical protein